jgi:hypothetical protein
MWTPHTLRHHRLCFCFWQPIPESQVGRAAVKGARPHRAWRSHGVAALYCGATLDSFGWAAHVCFWLAAFGRPVVASGWGRRTAPAVHRFWRTRAKRGTAQRWGWGPPARRRPARLWPEALPGRRRAGRRGEWRVGACGPALSATGHAHPTRSHRVLPS